MGRNAQPIQLVVANGKKHLTKAEITERQKHETRLKSGVREYKPSAQVKADMVALAMFKKLKKLYKDIDYVEGLDENVINRYCLLHSEWARLRDIRQDLTNQYVNAEPMEKLALADKMLELDRRIDKKMDLLLKLEDRLLLSPTARIKNVPKPKGPPKEDPNADLFD